MSRHEILDWVNAKIQFKVSKLEELCSGAEYCQMFEQIHPNSIGIKRIKFHAKMEHEYLHNFKLLQAAFGRLGIDKVVPVERLIKGRFQDNLEFIQWFRKFYESSPTALNKENSFVTSQKTQPPVKTSKSNTKKDDVRPVLLSQKSSDNLTRSPSPSTVEILEEQKQTLQGNINALQYDRNFYFNKLTAIEKLLNAALQRMEKPEWCERVLQVLYSQEPEEDS